MFWLFGQIWLWLLAAFALGAAVTWLLMRTLDRPKEPVYEPYEDAGYPEDEEHEEYAEAEYPEEHEPLEAERTQFIPPARVDHDGYYDDEPYDQETAGHREGRLPYPPPKPGTSPEEWPAEDEPAWPAAEDSGWPPAPHQPGRGG